MPQDYTAQVGYVHLFYPEDWAELPKPLGLEGVKWPPKRAQALLRADGSERCVGCEMKTNADDDVWTRDYAQMLKAGHKVRFLARDGRWTKGKVLRNISVKEMVVVATGKDLKDEVEVPWLAIKPSEPTPSDPQPQLCKCNISRWHSYSQRWHKHFELRMIPSPTDPDTTRNGEKLGIDYKEVAAAAVSVFAKHYVPSNRPIGELIGVLKPDLSHYSPSDPAIRDRTVSPPSRRSEAEIQKYRVSVPIGVLPPEEEAGENAGGDAMDIDNGNLTAPDTMDLDQQQEEGEGEQRGRRPCRREPTYALIDNYAFANFTRFIRHSCNPTVERYTARYGKVRMEVYFTRRAVYPGEEITEDFGLGYLRAIGGCECGAEGCQLPKAPAAPEPAHANTAM